MAVARGVCNPFLEQRCMISWVAAIAILCCFGAGSVLSGFFFQRSSYRFLISPLLGLGLATSIFCLCDRFLPPEINVFVTLLLVCGAGAIGWKSKNAEPAHFPSMPRYAGIAIAGLAVAAWFFAVGSLQLNPSLDFLLWDLTENAPGRRSAVLAAASLFGPDRWLGLQFLCGLGQVSVALGAFALARLVAPESRWAWILVAVFLLGSAHSGWLVFAKPEEVLIHLWGLGALFLLFDRDANHKALAAPLLAALFLVSWPMTVALILSLPRWKKMLVAFAFLGTAQNLYFLGFSPGLLVAASGVLLQLRKPGAVSEFAVRLCLLELICGAHGLFGLTALGLELATRLEKFWYETEQGHFRLSPSELAIPRREVLIATTLLTLWLGIDGAETVFNDVVLIGAQKEGVRYTRLALPSTMESWLDWRGGAFGFQAQDKETLEKLSGLEGTFVYLSGQVPDLRVAALISIALDRPFSGWRLGWKERPELPRDCALYLFTKDPETLERVGVSWVVVRGEEPLKPRTQDPPDKLVEVRLNPETGEPESIESVLVAAIAAPQPHEVPAASLIPVKLRLSNPTDFALDLSVYRGIVFESTYPHREPLRPIDFPVTPLNLSLLRPGATETVTAYLRTGINPLEYDLGIRLTRADGSSQPVPLSASFSVRSWRVELPLDYPYKEEKP